MKVLRPILFCVFFIACNQSNEFDANYYEKITGIKFPLKYNVLQTADNGEFVTISVLEFDKADCNTFYKSNFFKPIDFKFSPNLVGLYLLHDNYRKLPNTKSSLINYFVKTPGKVGWTYLLDTTTCRLYCEIEYPDAGGN